MLRGCSSVIYVCRPLSTHFARNLGLSGDMVQELAELPGTKNMEDLKSRAQALSQWKMSMQRGILPGPDTLDWPVEPFQTSFVNALNNLGMPRFTKRYPKLLDSLLRQMMQLVHVRHLLHIGPASSCCSACIAWLPKQSCKAVCDHYASNLCFVQLDGMHGCLD